MPTDSVGLASESTICGSRTLELLDLGTNAVPLYATISSTTNLEWVVDVLAPDATYVGQQHTMRVTTKLVNFPTITTYEDVVINFLCPANAEQFVKAN